MTSAMRRLPAQRRGRRLLALVPTGLALVLLLGACFPAGPAGVPSASTGQAAAPAATPLPPTPVDEVDAALLYAQCIRANGFPQFPDPNADGQFMLRRDQGISFNDPRYQAAQEACQDLRPAGLGGGDAADEERMETLLAFSRCMRENGVAGFPDPAPGSRGFLFSGGQLPFDPNSPGFQAAVQACQSHIQGGMMTGGAR